ncbi:MAG: hypothetical protein QNJ16_11585 [Rhodobacter sp.]|nr:hypothetical protein [Rhodobacter sp.]
MLSDQDGIILPWNRERVDEAGYRLAVGSEVYLAEAEGSEVRELAEKESFFIKPGQFAFLITEEVVNLPLGCIGFISVRAGTKFYGLVNVSGFHVDPGYKGKLIFAIFNSGPTRVNLSRGDDIFSIWMCDLSSPILEEDAPKSGYFHITSEVINKIDGEHLTAYQLSDQIDELDLKLKRVEQRVTSNRNWLVRGGFFITIIAFLFGIFVAPYFRSISQASKQQPPATTQSISNP